MNNQAITVFVISIVALYFFLGIRQPKEQRSSQEKQEQTSIKSSLATDSGKDAEEMNAFRAVFVTVPNIEVGKKIAHGLVTNKLAACVNIIPQVTSVYEWEGKINEDSELILMIKSQENLFAELEKFVKENHPYDVPEVIALPIQQGSKSYLDWISQVTKKN